MIKPDEKQRIVLKRLSQNDDFQKFVGMLEKSLVEKDKNNRIAKDIALYRSQGAATELEQIIKATNPV